MTPKEQEQRRKNICRLEKEGFTREQIAVVCECSRSLVNHVLGAYHKGGEAAIKQKKMGAPKGAGKKLTREQEKQIQAWITEKDPDQLKLKGCLWDRKNVAELIRVKFGIKMPLSTMGLYLSRWGFTAQRPTLRNRKQNSAEVNRWLEKEYPEVKRQAQEVGADIYWGDETGIQNTSNYIKGYAPVGKTPVLRTESDKFRVNMISAVNNQGKLRWMLYRDTMTQQRFIEFMERLVKSRGGRKVYFIVDNLKVHHGKIVNEWLASHKDEIAVFYLPKYSPELNPDEYLNGNLKREIAKRRDADNIAKLEKNAMSSMRHICRTNGRVQSFFRAKHVLYAA
jgi:transposase